MKLSCALSFAISIAMIGLTAGLPLYGQSAPSAPPAPAGAAEAGEAEFASSAAMQRLGLPKFALDECRKGHGFFCDFLSGMLHSIAKNRLPAQFSADLKLDELSDRAFNADCGKGDPYGCFQIGMKLKDRNRDPAAAEKYQRAVQVSEAACAKKIWPGCLLLLAISQSSDTTPQGAAQRENFLRLACAGGCAPACRYPAPEAFFTALNSSAGLGQLGGASMLWLCDQGRASHCALLGWNSLLGMPGVKADRGAALGHFQKACDLDDGMGCQMLGFAYRHGIGAQRNPARANRWMTRACDLKMGYACMTLGGDFWDASTHELNDAPQAFKLYTRSCEAENGAGCAMLAKMHLAGAGTALSPVKAKALLDKACRLKFEPACQTPANGD